MSPSIIFAPQFTATVNQTMNLAAMDPQTYDAQLEHKRIKLEQAFAQFETPSVEVLPQSQLTTVCARNSACGMMVTTYTITCSIKY